ncbi:MAG: S41 family peptidase, partial [Flavobacteriales bacterium]
MIRKNMALGLLAVGMLFSSLTQAQKTDPQSTTEKFGTLLYYIEQMYVDSVDSEALTEKAIRGMLEDLDPHSSYISSSDVQDANAPLKGNFDGIGIQFNILKDTILVVSPISGGPSEKLGIQAGDKIVTVDGQVVAGVGITNNDVRDKLMGPKDTKVTVGIKRKGAKKLIDFDIIRDKIPIYSVDASYMLDDNIGYIKVNRFGKTTMQELREGLVKMKNQGMKDLVLDLQGNGGGYLQTAIEMADEFLSEQKLIVFTQGRAFPKDDFYAKREGLFEKGRLVVLIDEGSASASEIVSGAIQDWDRGLIIGRRSFGKGLVQRPVPLPDGSEVRLTVQKYYTPSGRCIQKPYDDGVEAYRNEKYDRYDSGELYSIDGVEFPDSLKYAT